MTQVKLLKNGGMSDNKIVVAKRRRVIAIPVEVFSNRHLVRESTYMSTSLADFGT